MNGSPSPTRDEGGLRSLVELILQAARRKALLALGLVLLVSMTEWIGLLLLVPLLALTGLDVGEGTVGRIAEGAGAAFGVVGLTPSLPAVLGVYVVVVLLRGVLQRWQTLAAVDLERTVLVHLRTRLYTALVNAHWLFLSKIRGSDLMHALNTQCLTVSHATNTLLALISALVVGSVYLVLAFQLSAVMTLLVLASGVTLLALLRHGNRRAREAGARMNRSSSRLLGAMAEHLAGIKTVKSYSAEQRHTEIYARLSDDVAQTYRETQRNYATVRLWFDAGAVIILALLLYVSIELLALSTAEILLLLFLFGRLIPRFSGLQQSYQVLMHAMPSFAALMAQLRDTRDNSESAAGGAASPALSDAIRFEDLSFAYEAASRRAIDDLRLTIPANRTTAIVGASGAGKSTVADLVMGLLTPDEGHLKVDGTPLTPEVIRDWRRQIGYVAQDTFLFHDSIRANLSWAAPGASDAELWQALRLAAAEDFVSQFPHGLDTVIGDRGVLISGGERQRLALARALLRRPTVLILDEATSALDSENERQIQAAIEELQGSLTIVLITHRLSTVRNADVIHVLERGRLVESGSWEELVAGGGRFAELCRAQGVERLQPPVLMEADRERIAAS